MNAEQPGVKFPLLVVDEFLPAAQAAACLAEAVDLRPIYLPSRVGQGTQNRQDPNWRTNEVVYLDGVFGAYRERSKILTHVIDRIHSPEGNALWHDGPQGPFTELDIINYSTWKESVLSRYGETQFYEWHQDTKFNGEEPHRLVTLVYYMQVEPARFAGGELSLKFKDEQIEIPPRHNRAVVFPSFIHHRVNPVHLASPEWAHGRFSLNHWIGFDTRK